MNAPREPAPPSPPDGALAARIVPATIVAAALAIAFAVRVRLLDLPLERDEGEYAHAAQLLLDGCAPYGELRTMKLPGTSFAYAAFLAVLGQTPAAIHLGLAVWTTASSLAVLAVGRRLLDPLAAAVAAAAFALLSLSPSVLGLAGHATHFVVLPALAGCRVLLRPDGVRGRSAAAAGLLFGVAFLMKQQAAPLVLFGLLFAAFRSRADGRRAVLSRAGLFALAAALPWALLCAALAAAGVFPEFWFWTVTYARAYVSDVPLADAPGAFADAASGVIAANPALWAVAAAGGAVFLVRPRGRDARVFAAGFAACSVAAVCPGFHFREHYFIVALPAAALLAGAGVAAFRGTAARGVAAALATAAMAAGLVRQADPLFRWDPTTLCRAQYGGNPFPESAEIARRIAADTAPDERVAVLGSEPQILFLAHRRSVTRAAYVYPLMEAHPWAAGMQDEVIREIETARPRYVVAVRVGTSWQRRPWSRDRIFRWMNSEFFGGYEVVGLADVPSDGPPAVRWGPAAAAAVPRGPAVVVVLRRRE